MAFNGDLIGKTQWTKYSFRRKQLDIVSSIMRISNGMGYERLLLGVVLGSVCVAGVIFANLANKSVNHKAKIEQLEMLGTDGNADGSFLNGRSTALKMKPQWECYPENLSHEAGCP
jgi:hypothetical protein